MFKRQIVVSATYAKYNIINTLIQTSKQQQKIILMHIMTVVRLITTRLIILLYLRCLRQNVQ